MQHFLSQEDHGQISGNGDGDLNPSKLMMLDREFHRPGIGKDGTSKLPFLPEGKDVASELSFLLEEVIAAHAVV